MTGGGLGAPSLYSKGEGAESRSDVFLYPLPLFQGREQAEGFLCSLRNFIRFGARRGEVQRTGP